MRPSLLLVIVAIAVQAGVAPPAASAASANQKRDRVRTMARTVLERLYEAQPRSRRVIEDAAGFAVFGNFGIRILFFGGGSAKGIAVDNETRKETFMKAVEARTGPGFGAKKLNVVFVFETREAMRNFVAEGWQFGERPIAVARFEGQRSPFEGAAAVAPDVWAYQLTRKGLAPAITARGTRYVRDDDLDR